METNITPKMMVGQRIAAPSTPAAKPLQRTLGPVADLEAHLPEEWWSKLFNALYVKTDGDVVENPENTSAEVEFLIKAAAITPESRILDLCCGQGRHSLELARQGYNHVTGLDRSRYLVRLARKRAAAESLVVTIKEGDARTPRLADGSFDCVAVMGNSFGYFADRQDDAKVLTSIGKLLTASGTLVLDLTDGAYLRDHYEPRSWEWIDAHHFVCRERSLAADGERLISREVIVHDEMGVLADQFYAERLYSQESIMQLLERLGFRHIRFHGILEARSDREQDLGMMARRMLITADAPLKPAKAVPGKRAPLDVAVLLGDPRLPDQVKRGGQFNAEDFATVNALKGALAGLPGFTFRYFDNHATLQRDLAQARPDLVFNLCDEGFNNNAFHELHVPALLELMGLPYTGAGPQCLAACYDKALVRALAQQLDVPVPLETYIRIGDQAATQPSVFPAILKPNFGDSSEGITQQAVVQDTQGLFTYLDKLRGTFPDRPVLVQEFLPGQEYSVALVGNPGQALRALPVLEVDYAGLPQNLPPILGYESKWQPDSPYWTQIAYRPAVLEEEQQQKLVDYSSALFERLACRDYARFDFRAGADGVVKLLEVNPNPGWCWDGKFNLMAGFEGRSYDALLQSVLNAAVERLGVKARKQVKAA